MSTIHLSGLLVGGNQTPFPAGVARWSKPIASPFPVINCHCFRGYGCVEVIVGFVYLKRQ
jgi:hypothetical protein